ncbi:MAG: alpha/beta fold hydrolase [Candidatus Omnitrophica bacterium]|nr:alpha/beta fold hydrolase [Candidatus Omnitrophota bacterium]
MNKYYVIVPLILTGFLTTSDHHKVAYRHYESGHDKVVIIAHGFYNSKDAVQLRQLADELTAEYDVFMFDFRGHGESSGYYTWTSTEGRDLKAVLDHIEGKYKKTGMIAFSFGANVAINNLASDKRVDSLVSVSAATDPGKIDYKFWNLDFKDDLIYTLFTVEGWKGRGFWTGPFWLKKEKPIDNIDKLEIPVLFIHGEKDWVISPWHSKALYDRTRSQKKLVMIKNGPHAEYILRDSRDEFLREVKEWFRSTL